MNQTPRQLQHLDGVELDSRRRRERNKKVNPEESLNQGTKTMRYVQTEKERTLHRVLYMVFSILSFLLTVLVYFLSDVTNGLLGLITIWLSMVLGVAHIYRSTTQLVIDDAMTESMFLLAVRNFQLVNIVYAVVMTAASVILTILTITQMHAADAASSSKPVICIISLILATLLAWAMPVIESRRKLEPCRID